MKFLRVFLLLLVPLSLLAALLFLTTDASSYKVYVINTGSMSPTIPPGSAVVVHEGHYHVGQVITFTEGGLTVTHRLVSISAQGLTTTKGDGNRTDDPWHVPKSDIVGGVVLAPRYVGYWITYFKNPLGLISVVLAFLSLGLIWSFTSEKEPETEQDGDRANRKERKSSRRKSTGTAEVPVDVPAPTLLVVVDEKPLDGEGAGGQSKAAPHESSKLTRYEPFLAPAQSEPVGVSVAETDRCSDRDSGENPPSSDRRNRFEHNRSDHPTALVEMRSETVRSEDERQRRARMAKLFGAVQRA